MCAHPSPFFPWIKLEKIEGVSKIFSYFQETCEKESRNYSNFSSKNWNVEKQYVPSLLRPKMKEEWHWDTRGSIWDNLMIKNC